MEPLLTDFAIIVLSRVFQKKDWGVLRTQFSKTQWEDMQRRSNKSQRFRYDYFADSTTDLNPHALKTMCEYFGFPIKAFEDMNSILQEQNDLIQKAGICNFADYYHVDPGEFI